MINLYSYPHKQQLNLKKCFVNRIGYACVYVVLLINVYDVFVFVHFHITLLC